MAAVVGLLQESLTEALKGFYKVRKAVFALQTIADAEEAYQRKQRGSASLNQSRADLNHTRSTRRTSSVPDIRQVVNKQQFVLDNDDDDDESLKNADETAGEPDMDKRMNDMSLRANGSSRKGDDLAAILDSQPSTGTFVHSSLLTNPTDRFIHSGYCVQQGMLLLMLSLVPPTFSRILTIVGFRGNKDQGLALLWEAIRCSTASSMEDQEGSSAANGAVAGLMILGYYRGIVSATDILPPDSIPEARLQPLLWAMRAKFPGSRLWMLEESRMHSTNRDLPTAIRILEAAEPPSPLKQVEALRWFEHGLCTMFMHDYAKCAASFVKCVGLNNWSHGMYYYIAAAAHIELYRTAKFVTPTNEQAAAENKKKATEYLAKVLDSVGKKKFMGRQLPFDAFVARKVHKWTARGKEWNVDIVDAAGVSPIVEMIFFWGGHKKMGKSEMTESLRRLWWSDGGAFGSADSTVEEARFDMKPSPFMAQESDDEGAILALLRGTIHRHLGDTKTARQLLNEHIIKHSPEKFKAGMQDNWVAPVARYETAVCAWRESGIGSDMQIDPKERAAKLAECGRVLQEVASWESYDLDTRFGIKIKSGQDTVKRYQAGK